MPMASPCTKCPGPQIHFHRLGAHTMTGTVSQRPTVHIPPPDTQEIRRYIFYGAPNTYDTYTYYILQLTVEHSLYSMKKNRHHLKNCTKLCATQKSKINQESVSYWYIHVGTTVVVCSTAPVLHPHYCTRTPLATTTTLPVHCPFPRTQTLHPPPANPFFADVQFLFSIEFVANVHLLLFVDSPVP